MDSRSLQTYVSLIKICYRIRKNIFLELISTGKIEKIEPSDVWYEERKDYSVDAIGTKRVMHNDNGFVHLQGKSVFSGKILGGCIESIFDIFDSSYHNDSVEMCQKYQLFPELDDWKDKILLIETARKGISSR